MSNSYIGRAADLYDFRYRGAHVAIYEPVVILKPEVITLMDGVRIDSFVDIRGGEGVYIGRGVHVANHASVNIGGGNVVIADYAAVAAGARVIGGSNMPDGLSMSAAAPPDMQVVKRDYTVLERYSCMLVNSVILPGRVLAEGAVLAAGAVLTHDAPEWSIMAGVPARKIGDRRRPGEASITDTARPYTDPSHWTREYLDYEASRVDTPTPDTRHPTPVTPPPPRLHDPYLDEMEAENEALRDAMGRMGSSQ